PRPISSTQIIATANGCKMYGSPLFRRVVLCASAAISNATLTCSLLPGFNFGFKALNNARYLRRISFFSSSSFIVYFGMSSVFSINYEFTQELNEKIKMNYNTVNLNFYFLLKNIVNTAGKSRINRQ